MPKSRKNSSQLTEIDLQLVYDILVKVGIRLYESIHRIESPKDFAKIYRSKNIGNNTNLARLFLLYRTQPDPNKPLTPKELNQQIAENLVSDIQDDPGDMLSSTNEFTKPYFIPQNRMSEVLSWAETSGLFLHIDNKKEMRKLIPYRKKYLEGTPSAYKISLNAEKITSLLSKPEALKILVTSLTKSKLLYHALKYNTSSFLYAVREKYITNEDLPRFFRVLIDEDPNKISDVTYSMIDNLSIAHNDDIEEIADQATKAFIHLLVNDKRDLLIRLFTLLSISKLT